MRRNARSRVDSWLLLVTGVGLCGCPLLLDDDFTTAVLSTPGDEPICVDPGCGVHSSGSGGSSGVDGGAESGGAAGAESGGAAGAATGGAAGAATGGAAGAAGTLATGGASGSSGSAGTAGGAGSGASAGAAGSAGSGGTPDAGDPGGPDACRSLTLAASTYAATSNCLGVHGTNKVEKDTGTTLALGYESGDPCFTGTIAPSSSGWGATFELTFRGDDNGKWDAAAAGVTGFEFAYRGNAPPASLKVIYKDSSPDNCIFITGSSSVPFTAAHPGSSCGSSGSVDSSEMDELILAFVPTSQAYAVEFCLHITALD